MQVHFLYTAAGYVFNINRHLQSIPARTNHTHYIALIAYKKGIGHTAHTPNLCYEVFLVSLHVWLTILLLNSVQNHLSWHYLEVIIRFLAVWEEQKSNFHFHFHLAQNRARSVRALLAQYSWESTSHKLEERDWLHGHNTSFYQEEVLASNVILFHQLKVHAVLSYLGLQTAWAAEQKKRVVEIGAQV